MESMFRLMRKRLFLAFFDWLDTNKQMIGSWYDDLYSKGKDAEAQCDTLMKLMGDSLWMFNMIANLGVWAGLAPNRFDLQALKPGLDEQSSKRILALMSSILALQQLPLEILHQEFPIISSKKFSLKLFMETH
jgi:hypothetical protein